MTADTYTVRLTKAAQKDLDGLPADIRKRIAGKLRRIEVSPRIIGNKLKGSSNTYRIRQGSYRVLFEVWDNVRTVVVTRIVHRREAYRNIGN